MKFQFCCEKCSRQIPCPDNKEGCLVYHCKCDNPNCECHQEEILCSRCKTNTLDKCPCPEVRDNVSRSCCSEVHLLMGKDCLCSCKCHFTPPLDNKVKPEGVGEWEKEFDMKLNAVVSYAIGGECGGVDVNYCKKELKSFISNLLLQEKAKCMADFEKRLEEYRNSPDVWKKVGVSKWRNWGEQNGYFEFFKAKWKGEDIKIVYNDMCEQLKIEGYEKGRKEVLEAVLERMEGCATAKECRHIVKEYLL